MSRVAPESDETKAQRLRAEVAFRIVLGVLSGEAGSGEVGSGEAGSGEAADSWAAQEFAIVAELANEEWLSAAPNGARGAALLCARLVGRRRHRAAHDERPRAAADERHRAARDALHRAVDGALAGAARPFLVAGFKALLSDLKKGASALAESLVASLLRSPGKAAKAVLLFAALGDDAAKAMRTDSGAAEAWALVATLSGGLDAPLRAQLETALRTAAANGLERFFVAALSPGAGARAVPGEAGGRAVDVSSDGSMAKSAAAAALKAVDAATVHLVLRSLARGNTSSCIGPVAAWLSANRGAQGGRGGERAAVPEALASVCVEVLARLLATALGGGGLSPDEARRVVGRLRAAASHEAAETIVRCVGLLDDPRAAVACFVSDLDELRKHASADVARSDARCDDGEKLAELGRGADAAELGGRADADFAAAAAAHAVFAALDDAATTLVRAALRVVLRGVNGKELARAKKVAEWLVAAALPVALDVVVVVVVDLDEEAPPARRRLARAKCCALLLPIVSRALERDAARDAKRSGGAPVAEPDTGSGGALTERDVESGGAPAADAAADEKAIIAATAAIRGAGVSAAVAALGGGPCVRWALAAALRAGGVSEKGLAALVASPPKLVGKLRACLVRSPVVRCGSLVAAALGLSVLLRSVPTERLVAFVALGTAFVVVVRQVLEQVDAAFETFESLSDGAFFFAMVIFAKMLQRSTMSGAHRFENGPPGDVVWECYVVCAATLTWTTAVLSPILIFVPAYGFPSIAETRLARAALSVLDTPAVREGIFWAFVAFALLQASNLYGSLWLVNKTKSRASLSSNETSDVVLFGILYLVVIWVALVACYERLTRRSFADLLERARKSSFFRAAAELTTAVSRPAKGLEDARARAGELSLDVSRRLDLASEAAGGARLEQALRRGRAETETLADAGKDAVDSELSELKRNSLAAAREQAAAIAKTMEKWATWVDACEAAARLGSAALGVAAKHSGENAPLLAKAECDRIVAVAVLARLHLLRPAELAAAARDAKIGDDAATQGVHDALARLQQLAVTAAVQAVERLLKESQGLEDLRNEAREALRSAGRRLLATVEVEGDDEALEAMRDAHAAAADAVSKMDARSQKLLSFTAKIQNHFICRVPEFRYVYLAYVLAAEVFVAYHAFTRVLVPLFRHGRGARHPFLAFVVVGAACAIVGALLAAHTYVAFLAVCARLEGQELRPPPSSRTGCIDALVERLAAAAAAADVRRLTRREVLDWCSSKALCGCLGKPEKPPANAGKAAVQAATKATKNSLGYAYDDAPGDDDGQPQEEPAPLTHSQRAEARMQAQRADDGPPPQIRAKQSYEKAAPSTPASVVTAEVVSVRKAEPAAKAVHSSTRGGGDDTGPTAVQGIDVFLALCSDSTLRMLVRRATADAVFLEGLEAKPRHVLVTFLMTKQPHILFLRDVKAFEKLIKPTPRILTRKKEGKKEGHWEDCEVVLRCWLDTAPNEGAFASALKKAGVFEFEKFIKDGKLDEHLVGLWKISFDNLFLATLAKWSKTDAGDWMKLKELVVSGFKRLKPTDQDKVDKAFEDAIAAWETAVKSYDKHFAYDADVPDLFDIIKAAVANQTLARELPPIAERPAAHV